MSDRVSILFVFHGGYFMVCKFILIFPYRDVRHIILHWVYKKTNGFFFLKPAGFIL